MNDCDLKQILSKADEITDIVPVPDMSNKIRSIIKNALSTTNSAENKKTTE